MGVILKPDQEAWLRRRVANGDFASVDEAAQQLLAERIAEREMEEDDLSWARPFVEEGLAALERGEVVSSEEYTRRMDALMASLRS